MTSSNDSSLTLLNGDRPRSPLYRDDDDGFRHEQRVFEKPPPRKARRFNKQVVVGLVTLLVVVAIGFGATRPSSHQPWNTSSASPTPQAPAGSPAGKPATDIADASRLMTASEWQTLHDNQFDPKKFVRGPPTTKFRDNLVPGVKYMSGWIAGGWTNDFMTYINLIYIAHITRPRVPIIGQFHPTHVGQEAGYLHFGDVFDVPRMSRLLQMPVLEWRDVKSENSTEIEEVGCWSAWQNSGPDQLPRHSFIPEILNLDISYTAAPKSIKISPDPWDWFVLFWPLAQLAYPEGRAAVIAEEPAQKSPLHNATHPPDEQMVCYDFLYFAGAAREDEWFSDYSPAWREVGTHAHWAPRVDALARGYLARHFGADVADLPPFVAVHVRRNDFVGWCGDVPQADCFAPVADYARRVDEVRADVLARHGVNVTNVIVTSDEKDAAWWAEVKARGWSWIDHGVEKTEAKYGKWYPVLIDAVIQSMGAGFVGTDRSTMSMVAARRVEDWNDGPTRYVRWGWKGADEHRKRALSLE